MSKMESIVSELEALRDKNGKILPASCVAWAKTHPKSALSQHLIWDDSVAAERYRVWQVRELLQVHLIDATGGRRFVSLSIDRTNGGGYRAMSDVMKRPDLKAIMLADALTDLETMQRRYERLSNELAPVWSAAERVRKQHQKKQAA